MERIYKWLLLKNNFHWTNILQKVTVAYNDQVQEKSLFGLSPRSIVWNKKNEKMIMKKKAMNLVEYWTKLDKNQPKPKFSIGQRVRHVTDPVQWRKGTMPQYSTDIYEIESINENQMPRLYKLKGSRRSFYPSELVVTKEDPEKAKKRFIVLKKRTLGRQLRSQNKSNEKTEFLVRDINSPQIPSNWISSEDLSVLKRNGSISESFV